MTVGKVFIDTNILLRAFHQDFPEHTAIRSHFDQLIADNSELWISRQVIREYLVQVTHVHTFKIKLSEKEISQQLTQMLHLVHVADEDWRVTQQLLFLLETYSTRGKQIHDANIVATMLANDIDTLFTLNEVDFRRYADRIRIMTIT